MERRGSTRGRDDENARKTIILCNLVLRESDTTSLVVKAAAASSKGIDTSTAAAAIGTSCP